MVDEYVSSQAKDIAAQECFASSLYLSKKKKLKLMRLHKDSGITRDISQSKALIFYVFKLRPLASFLKDVYTISYSQ